MPDGIRFGQQVPQQVDPNLLSILRAALVGTGRDIGGAGRGALSQLGQGIQSPAFPFVPPVPTQAINLGRIGVSAPAQAQPQIPPQGLPPTQPVREPTTPPAKAEEKKGGISDSQRQLLATALQVGLPLALAGFGGRRGLAAGAGLATGFGQAATQQRRLEAFKDQPVFTIDPETGQLTQTGTVPKGAKVVKKPAKKEDDVEKLLEGILGTQVTPPAEAGKEIAGQVQRATEKAKQINVTDPQGQPGTIPANQLQDALKQGFKRR